MIVGREHPENSQDALWPVIYDFVYGQARSAVASVHLQGWGLAGRSGPRIASGRFCLRAIFMYYREKIKNQKLSFSFWNNCDDCRV